MKNNKSDFSVEEDPELEMLEIEESKACTADDWFTLGINAFLHGAYQKAIDCFDHVLDIDPKNARAYANRGDVHYECGEYEEALNDYEMAVFCGSREAASLRDELKSELAALKKQQKSNKS